MAEEPVWRRRFLLFTVARLAGLSLFFLGLAIALTDLLRPGGSALVGGAVAVLGLAEALVVPLLLKQAWRRP